MAKYDFHHPTAQDRTRGAVILLLGLGFLAAVAAYFFSSLFAIERLATSNPGDACREAEVTLRQLLQLGSASFFLLALYYFRLGTRVRREEIYPLDKTASLFRIRAVRGARAKTKGSAFIILAILLLVLTFGAGASASCIEVPCKQLQTLGLSNRDIERYTASRTRGRVITFEGCSLFGGGAYD